MSSQSNILITQLIYDSEFDDNNDGNFTENNKEVPMIGNGEIRMRLGHDGGPSMINYMLNLSFYHLKSLCYHGWAEDLKMFIEQHDLLKTRFKDSDFKQQFASSVNRNGRLFGLGVEYVSQILSLAYGTQIYSLASNGEDLWGENESPTHIITCYHEGKEFIINFNVSEDTSYTIAKDPSFFPKLREEIKEYNEKIITPEYKQYYITPLERGFSIQYNMILALQIMRHREQIMQECENKNYSELYDGFILKE